MTTCACDVLILAQRFLVHYEQFTLPESHSSSQTILPDEDKFLSSIHNPV